MPISNPMGKVPTGVSTSDVVTKLDIGPTQDSEPIPVPSVSEAETDPGIERKRKQLESLRLDNEIAKQKAIKAGKIPLTKIY